MVTSASHAPIGADGSTAGLDRTSNQRSETEATVAPSSATTPPPASDSGWASGLTRIPLSLVTGIYAGAKQLAGDPRVMGVLRAGPRVGLFLARGNRRSAGPARTTASCPSDRPRRLALQAYLDEVLIALFRHPDLLPSVDDYAPAAADLAGIRELFSARGWLEHPADYHRNPEAPDDVRAWHERAPGLGYEHITFTSGWEPDPDEAGRDRWLSHEANRTVHAWVSRAPGREHRSWLICAHGFGMGTERVDGPAGISHARSCIAGASTSSCRCFRSTDRGPRAGSAARTS